jgi:hypothetical protein
LSDWSPDRCRSCGGRFGICTLQWACSKPVWNEEKVKIQETFQRHKITLLSSKLMVIKLTLNCTLHWACSKPVWNLKIKKTVLDLLKPDKTKQNLKLLSFH